ncbi:hypothetical protein IL306_004797 [Fusarium sp. DS 682]|nr:hypothetical protein IL306_004797 [Fusarium sp. DS 682]
MPEYILENTEQILMRDALDIMNPRLAMVLYRLRGFAIKHQSLSCVMFESELDKRAWVTTIGERGWYPIKHVPLQDLTLSVVATWASMLIPILTAFESTRLEIGSAGSQPITAEEQLELEYEDKASMLELFGGDVSKCERIDELLRQKMGFEKCYAKTYPQHRLQINTLLGSACEILGKQVLQIVDDLNHFDANEQLVEKRPRRDGLPVTHRDPKCRQSGHLQRAAFALINASVLFKNPEVSKTEGEGEYIMARMFTQAARVVGVLESIIRGLYCDPRNGFNLLYCEMPFIITGELIDWFVAGGNDRTGVQAWFQKYGMLACGRSGNHYARYFFSMLYSYPFARFQHKFIQTMQSVADITKSKERVEEICGENSELAKKLEPYLAYTEEKMADEMRNFGLVELARERERLRPIRCRLIGSVKGKEVLR